jgi:hypothetical protein
MSQGNSLCSYLQKTKTSFFFLFFTKSENRRAEQVFFEGEDVGRGCRWVNMVQILCTYVHKWENETYQNYSKNGVKKG